MLYDLLILPVYGSNRNRSQTGSTQRAFMPKSVYMTGCRPFGQAIVQYHGYDLHSRLSTLTSRPFIDLWDYCYHKTAFAAPLGIRHVIETHWKQGGTRFYKRLVTNQQPPVILLPGSLSWNFVR